MTVRDELRRMGAFAWRDARIQFSYQLQLISFFTGAFFAAVLSYYISGLVSGSEEIDAFDGTYFEFVVAGIALTSYAGFGISTFTKQMSAEQSAGTLEILLSGQHRLWVVLVGGMIVPFALTTVEAGLLIGVGLGVVGTGFSVSGLLGAIPIVVLTVVCFGAFGFVSAAFTLLAKRGDPISGPVFQLTLFTSGVIFPIEVFPGWLEAICRLTPGYYGVRGLREVLLTDGGFGSIVDELLILGGFAVVLVPLGLWTVSRAIATAKTLGVLGSQ